MQTVSTINRTRLVEPDRTCAILATSIYRELTSNGYNREQILTIASELIGRVTTEIDSGDLTTRTR